ncbi:hypothetical protein BDZ89DRAFT_1152088 [Hymenopellis radicata]|nr:hypothetical protein BDZ89DRAFT_1152088 [Hymenopellis radicata]
MSQRVRKPSNKLDSAVNADAIKYPGCTRTPEAPKKKGSLSVAGVVVPPKTISPEEQRRRAQHKKEEQKRKAAEKLVCDAEIRSKAEALKEEEAQSSESDVEKAPSPKAKSKLNVWFSQAEATNRTRKDDTDEEEDANAAAATSPAPQSDDEQFGEENMSGAEVESDNNSDLVVEDVTPVTPQKRRRSDSASHSSPSKQGRKSYAAYSPRHQSGSPVRGSSSAHAVAVGRAKKAHKRTEADFTPRRCRLLRATKLMVRRDTALDNAFVPASGRIDFVMTATRKVLQEKAYANPENQETVNRMKSWTDEEIYDFVVFAMYGRGAQTNSFVGKGHNAIPMYGIPGSMNADQIKDTVKWMIKTKAYMYGGLDVKARTFNKDEPFQGDIFAVLIRTQFVSTKGTGDVLVFKELLDKQAVPGPMFAYCQTIAEHCISQWSEGVFKEASFTDAAASSAGAS